MEKIICILVLYKPNTDILKKAVNSIIQQVDTLYMSDNTPGGYVLPDYVNGSDTLKIVFKSMNGNVGIAKAQNAGIQYAIDNGYEYIYFLDQDSISEPNTVSNLLARFKKLKEMNIKVGAVGPQPYNRQTGKDYKPNVKKGHVVTDGVVELSELINSASLFCVDLFRDAGLMDEGLFIDGVDHEVCWRAWARSQYRFFMVNDLHLSHQLGEGDQKFLGISVKIPTPFRTYYQFRNYFILSRRSYVPVYWKLSNGIKFFCKYFYFPLACKNGKEYFKI